MLDKNIAGAIKFLGYAIIISSFMIVSIMCNVSSKLENIEGRISSLNYNIKEKSSTSYVSVRGLDKNLRHISSALSGIEKALVGRLGMMNSRGLIHNMELIKDSVYSLYHLSSVKHNLSEIEKELKRIRRVINKRKKQ